MRSIERIPQPLRKTAKTLVPHAFRQRIHDFDYQIGQVVETYKHHLLLDGTPSWTNRAKTAGRIGVKLFNRPVILSYPSLPGPGSVIYKLLLHLGYRVTDNPYASYDLAMRFEWKTYGKMDSVIHHVSSRSRVINLNAVDISKSTVCDVFEDVFPYSLRVDPRTFDGPILRKSDLNATHDGTILQGPLSETQNEFVYQRLINNVDDQLAKDLRVMVVGGEIPFVRVKYRPVEKRFEHAGRSQVRDEVRLATEVFTPTEQDRILTLCQKMGLDFGELDVLRDRDTDRVYVVDVNKTPTGPTFVSADRDTIKWCFDAMGRKFANAFMPESSLT